MDNTAELIKMFKSVALKSGAYTGKRLPAHLREQIENTYMGEMTTYKEKIYALLTGCTTRPRCECGMETSLISTSKGFARFCSTACSANSEQTKKTKEQTNLIKFGVTNPFASQKIQQKIHETSMQRYNTTAPASNPLSRLKAKNTLIANFGVDNAGKTESSKKAASKTMSSPEVRLKIQSTNMAKYGAISSLSDSAVRDKSVKTMLSRYGVTHNSYCPTTILSRQKTSARSYASNILPARLSSLRSLNIFPDGWDESTFPGGNVPFIHTDCGTTFHSSFEDGRIPTCPECRKSRSAVQQLLSNRLLEFCDIKQNDRTVIRPKEIDILIGNVGIEVNGVYWHSDAIAKTSLLEKTNLANNAGVKLLHFWDYEIYNSTDIVVSIILSKLKLNPHRVFARSCKFKRLELNEARVFFNENHLAGFIAGSHYFGLKNKHGDIIYAVIIGSPRFTRSKEDLEIYRLCSAKFNYVVGGFEKILSNIKQILPNKNIVSFADKRYSDGLYYEKVGFKRIAHIKPNYMWIKGSTRLNRYKTQKHLLPKLLGDKFNKDLSESNNMLIAGWSKITDCGNIKYILST